MIKAYGEVNLFTRPRRFGKTLNMSILKAFFEIEADVSLFNGLNISHEKPILCEDALKQIEETAYAEALYDDGFSHIWAYGITFFKKSCRVRAKTMDEQA